MNILLLSLSSSFGACARILLALGTPVTCTACHELRHRNFTHENALHNFAYVATKRPSNQLETVHVRSRTAGHQGLTLQCPQAKSLTWA
jgi:hypothetical protein